MQFGEVWQCSFVECGLVYLFFSLHAVCSPLGRIFNIATNVSFVSCSFLRCSRCSFPCVFSLVYIVIVFVRCFICSFNRTVYRSRLKLLELVTINRQWQLQKVLTSIAGGICRPLNFLFFFLFFFYKTAHQKQSCKEKRIQQPFPHRLLSLKRP